MYLARHAQAARAQGHPHRQRSAGGRRPRVRRRAHARAGPRRPSRDGGLTSTLTSSSNEADIMVNVVDWGDRERRLTPSVSVLVGDDGGRYPSGNSLLVRGKGEAVDHRPVGHGGGDGRGAGRTSTPSINSHSHEDHMAGNGLYSRTRRAHPRRRSARGAQPRRADGRVRAHRRAAGGLRRQVVEEFHYTPRPDAEGFHDGHVFELGGAQVEAVHLPGHTRGHSGFRVSAACSSCPTSTSPDSARTTATCGATSRTSSAQLRAGPRRATPTSTSRSTTRA